MQAAIDNSDDRVTNMVEQTVVVAQETCDVDRNKPFYQKRAEKCYNWIVNIHFG